MNMDVQGVKSLVSNGLFSNIDDIQHSTPAMLTFCELGIATAKPVTTIKRAFLSPQCSFALSLSPLPAPTPVAAAISCIHLGSGCILGSLSHISV